MTEIYYRAVDYRIAAPVDEFDEPTGPSTPALKYDELPVVKHTPKGVRLRDASDRVRTVLHKAKKRFAEPTKEKALASWFLRKERQTMLLTRQLAHVEEIIKVMRDKT